MTRTSTDFDADTPSTGHPIECDVRDVDQVSRMIEAVDDQLGGLDILVNNASAVFNCSVADLSENAWKTIVDITLNSVFNSTRAAWAPFVENGGTVVIISSIRGHRRPGGSRAGGTPAGRARHHKTY